MHIRQQEIDTQFFTPRTYQLELVDKAKQRNIIVPLGTGTGKTFIAVMLIKELAAPLRIPLDKDGKRSFFLVDKVPLVSQQAEQIRKFTDLSVGEFHGKMNVDLWTEGRWREEITKNQVMVMTAQVFLNLLNHGYISVKRTNVMIFDECHHARKNHPYREIMRHYLECDQCERPRILGLTASVVNDSTKPQKLEQKMKELELALSATIETTSDLTSVAQYGAKPKISVIACKNFEDATKMTKICRKFLMDVVRFCERTDFDPELELDPCKTPIDVFNKVLSVLAQLGPWCAWKVAKTLEKRVTRSHQFAMTDWQERFQLLLGCYLKATIHMLEMAVKNVKSIDDILRVTPPKVARLLEILKFFNPEARRKALEDNKNAAQDSQNMPATEPVIPRRRPVPTDPTEFSGIVFVEQRYVAYILKVLLGQIQRLDRTNFGYLKLDFVVGFSGYKVDTDDPDSIQTKQNEVLGKFRRRELNLLIATSVLEEGVDVRQCNCVIRFDLPKEFRSYVQSKGRARKTGSYFFILAESHELESFDARLKNYMEIEKILLEHSKNRDNPPAELVDLHMADQIMPPWYPDLPVGIDAKSLDGRPRVSMTTAIALVNRYCARLPSDIFTRLTPKSEILSVALDGTEAGAGVGYRAKVWLPINSPVKEAIEGAKMPNKKFAQMAVAMEVCKVLHKRGELDHHLLPVGKEALRSEWWDDDDDEDWSNKHARPGTTHRRQYYDKKIADPFTNSLPLPDKPCYVHIVEQQVVVPLAAYSGPTMHLGMDRCFGFLSAKPLPYFPSFPIYTRQGETRCSFRTLPGTITLVQDRLVQIALFHHYIFAELLRLEKFSMKFAPESSSFSMFLVPLKKDGSESDSYVVDLESVASMIAVINDLPRHPNDDDRENAADEPFDAEKFNNAIVMPWYRNAEAPHYYHVASICAHLKPSSNFPDSEYGTFNDYFMEKYGMTIFKQDQPLLDVDYTSTRLNLLTPRQLPSRHSRVDRGPGGQSIINQRQILVPELVDVHPIPSSMWILIVTLPSVLYRANHLLLADEFRIKVEQEAFEKTGDLPAGFEWDPLDFGWNKNLESYLESLAAAALAAEEEEAATVPKFVVANDFEDSDPPKSQKKSEPKVKSASSRKDNFDVGVWDPTLADHLKDTPINEIVPVGPPPLPEAPAVVGWAGPPKTAGLDVVYQPPSVANLNNGTSFGLQNGMRNNEDLWDMEMEEGAIYFDVDMKRQFMSTAQRFAAAAAEKEKDSVTPKSPSKSVPSRFYDPFAPDLTIEPTGWGDLPPEESASADGADDKAPKVRGNNARNGAGGLEFVSGAGGDENIDTEALMDDIEYDEISARTVRPKQNGYVAMKVPNGDAAPADSSRNFMLAEFDPLFCVPELKKNRVERPDEETIDWSDDEDKNPTGSQDPEPPPLIELESELAAKGVKLIDEFSTLDLAATQAPTVEKNSSESLKNSSNSSCENLDEIFAANLDDAEVFRKLAPNPNFKQIEAEIGDFRFEIDHRGDRQVGPSPCLLLQALTMSHASDGLNLERLETVGDSFLKYAMTVNLFHTHPELHEGKLSFLRSKYVSNYNLYKLGKRKRLGEFMVAAKFEPQDNWLPPGFLSMDVRQSNEDADEEDQRMEDEFEGRPTGDESNEKPKKWIPENMIPYNLLTQHSIPDKSIADAVESLIGSYLITYGPMGALQFMQWLGLKVLPEGSCEYPPVPDPLLYYVSNPPLLLKNLWVKHNFAKVEEILGYEFKQKAFLVQAFTHASYGYNRITDCYQRLEFLGDAVLDYLITRQLYEEKKCHSPGVLTDLRAALVNNTIFASLAVKCEFHKYFLHICPGLYSVIGKFVLLQNERMGKDVNFDAELYLLDNEGEVEEEEDIEVPKALGDIFESVAGAIYLDSNRSLDTVWRVYFRLMKDTIAKCTANPPRSPIRELLEMEPERVKFSRAERLVTEKKVRVTVDVEKKGRYTGLGRSYRIAKSTAAKRALRALKKMKAKEEEEERRRIAQQGPAWT